MNVPYPRIDIDSIPPDPRVTFGPSTDILIVDDNVAGAQILAMLLEMHGYSVITTPSGREAVAMTQEHQPRTILLDLGLPDVHGVEVARAIRDLHGPSGPKIIVLSGRDVELPPSTDPDELFDHVLAKPAPFEELQALLPPPRGSGQNS